MASLLRARRIVNPGRARRGNIGQIITLGLAGNPGRRKANAGTSRYSRKFKAHTKQKGYSGAKFQEMYETHKRKIASHKRRYAAKRAREENPMVITLGKIHKKRKINSMAKRSTRRVNTSYKPRRRTNPARRRTYAMTHRRRNSGTYKRRRRNGVFSSMKRSFHRRRRNPGFVSGATGGVTQALQIIGGAVVTNTAMGMIPASLSTGVVGYLSTAAVAILQGMAVGKLMKSPGLCKNMQLGGFVILGLKIIKDFFPSIGNPFGGMGLLAPSSFYNPQVPMNNSMVQFQLPAAISAGMLPAATSGAGMGRTMRSARQGRL